MFLDAPPTLSPADIMAKIKGVTSKNLREEIPHLQHLPSLWTRAYVSRGVMAHPHLKA